MTTEEPVDMTDSQAVGDDFDAILEPVDSSGVTESVISRPDLYHQFSNFRRRAVLKLLEGNEERSKGELAEVIAALETGKKVEEVDSSERNSVYVALHQNHLEELAEKEIIDYDGDRGDKVEKGDLYDVAISNLELGQISLSEEEEEDEGLISAVYQREKSAFSDSSDYTPEDEIPELRGGAATSAELEECREEGVDEIPAEVIYNLFENEYRVRAINCLETEDEPMTKKDLAKAVAAAKEGVEEENLTNKQYRRSYVPLHQTHLEKLEKWNIIEREDKIGQGSAFEIAEEYAGLDVLEAK